MLAQEWDWNKALEINARDATRSADEAWQLVVAEKDVTIADMGSTIADNEATIADKDAALANKDAEIAVLKAMLEASKTRD